MDALTRQSNAMLYLSTAALPFLPSAIWTTLQSLASEGFEEETSVQMRYPAQCRIYARERRYAVSKGPKGRTYRKAHHRR